MDAATQPLSSRRQHWVNELERHAQQQPGGVAIRFQGESVTWLELQRRTVRVADGLHRRGVGFGDRVLLLMMNRPEYVDIVLGAHRLGGIAVPVNFRLTAEEIAFIAQDSGAHVLFVDDVLADTARAACAYAGLQMQIVVVGPSGGESLAALMSEPGEPHPLVDVPEDSPALIMYTSGTTGRPKGAVLSHLNMLSQALTLIRTWRLFDDEGEVTLCASPLFHIAGLGGLGPMLLIGATVVIHPTGAFDASALLDTLETEGVTSIFLVPTQWQALCADPTVTERKLALRVTSWGAAPASVTLLERMAEVFPGVTNIAVFGQTEMSPVTCALRGEDALRKIGSVGKPISTVQVRVVDEQMNDVAPGEVGEIVYRGPGLMAGYWQNPVATDDAFAGGWFHSGDLVRVDDEGFIYVVDRKKDMLISGGENIYCAEVENVLAAHPDIVDVAVIGRPDERWGEVPVAVVVVAGANAPSVAELGEWLDGRLARYKRPKHLVVLDVMPRNASGKILKGPLREQYGR